MDGKIADKKSSNLRNLEDESSGDSDNNESTDVEQNEKNEQFIVLDAVFSDYSDEEIAIVAYKDRRYLSAVSRISISSDSDLNLSMVESIPSSPPPDVITLDTTQSTDQQDESSSASADESSDNQPLRSNTIILDTSGEPITTEEESDKDVSSDNQQFGSSTIILDTSGEAIPTTEEESDKEVSKEVHPCKKNTVSEFTDSVMISVEKKTNEVSKEAQGIYPLNPYETGTTSNSTDTSMTNVEKGTNDVSSDNQQFGSNPIILDTSGETIPTEEESDKEVSKEGHPCKKNTGSETTDSVMISIEKKTNEVSKEAQGLYPLNPYETGTASNSTDTSMTNVEKGTNEVSKEAQGIFPLNPYEMDTEIEVQGIYPQNPYEKDAVSDATDSNMTNVEKSAIALRTSEGEEKMAVGGMSSTKELFFLDLEGESDVKYTEVDNDVCIEGVSIDLDGDTSGSGVEDTTAYPVHEIPRYNTRVAGVLSDIEYSMETGKKVASGKPKKSCFNCLGDHNLPECTKPHDYMQINANRRKHMSNRVSNVRYHEEFENKYGQIRPGKISEHLREGLGIGHNQLPLYIYRMRCLGYPPGWLKEAEVRQADMKLFDGAGQSVSHPDEEDGEAEPTLVKYNPDKLISFPGFNVDVPRGCYDEWRDLNFPPMQPHHRKSEFKRFMEMNRAGTYKKRKLKDESLTSNGKDKNSSLMDIDDSEANTSAEIEFNPPLPEEDMPPLPPEESPAPEPAVPLEEGEVPADDSESSITFLEARRKALLEQLEDSGSKNSNDSNTKKEATPDDGNETESSIQQNNDSENSQSSSSNKEKVKHHRSHSKGYHLGVAIPASITPYTILPDAEKWTVDVTDHINFENLPDALGTWDKMKGLVKKVRKQMVVLHAEDDE